MLKYRPIVISGPSGSGKSTLLQKLFKEYPGCFEFSVSHTTRKPRAGEAEGKDYFFVERAVFEKMIEDGGFLEHAQFSGNCYGTSKMAVEKVQASGRICILDVAVNGVKSIKKTDLNARYIFVQPPSMEELEKRLRSRGSETEESLKRRLDSCKEAFDYSKEPGSYDHIIVNDDLEVAYEKLKGILSAIKCGAVYVTDADKTKHVTKNIVAQSTASEEKKKRASKYSLAIGSSFGHVHAFLKDSDHVLQALDQTKAEDKCLMLIRKPKSASKQMLKAHSWANLSAPDMHLRLPDGSMKPNPIPKPKRMIRTSADLTLPRDQSSKWQQNSANQKPSNKSLSNHSSSFKELPTVAEQQQEETKSDVLPWQQKKIDEENGNCLSYSYPSEQHPTFHSFGRAVSSIDLRHTEPEINNNSNNKMGGAFSKSQDKSRPKGPPPPVPNKAYKNSKNQSQTEYHNNNTQQMQVYSVNNDPRGSSSRNSRPDVISNVHDKNGNRQVKESVHIAHAKSDSGFYSETRISNYELYDYGFKQELDMSGGHMTSSPRSEKEKVLLPQRNGEGKPVDRNAQNSRSRMEPEPQRYSNNSSAVSKNVSPASKQLDENKVRMRNEKPDRTTGVAKEGYIRSETNTGVNKENSSRSGIRTNNTRNETAQRQHPSSPYYNGNQPGPAQTRSSKGTAASRPDYSRQKTHEDHRQGQRPSPAKDSEVMRAHSMGDLSAGCTFSLVGQKRNENVDDINNVGLTGTQLAEHFRKYRKIKQESKHGSLPFRGKSVDDVDVRGRLDEVQYSQPPSYNSAKPQRAMHYGSLQHLPMSSESYNADQRQMYSTKFREKTPMKPRRSLPQVPGDVDEKKKHLSEAVKTRICGSSRSNSSPSSGGSNRASEVRVGGVSATPSDREVSVLTGNHSDIVWVPPQNKKPVCNTSSSDSNHRQVLPPDGYYNSHYQSFGTTGTCGTQEHSNAGFTGPSGGRLSESGQTTLTSQSTIDSGYITNDPDQDPLSTSNYAKTVKQSAQNLYSSNKMFQPSKGDHSQGNIQNSNKGFNSQPARERGSSSKQVKETRTRNWLEKHPGSYMGDYLKMGLNVSDSDLTKNGQYDKIDTNNNKDIKYAARNRTELDLTNNVRPKETASKSHALMHHLSDPSGKESEKAIGGDIASFKCKGMSISMSQGLNMIEKNSRVSSGSFLSKSQPKFTGSLKDLLGADKQIVPIEALRGDNSQLASTLPGNWKPQQKPETSLKLLGKPSLFQLLQNYNLYAVRMKIPEGFNILENVRMIECEVVLPAVAIYGANSQLTSPKGNYAKIGGPFSAFRPVSNPNTQIRSVSMVTVMDLSSQITGMFEFGSIIKGDLVVEVNERLIVGEDLSSLNNLLQDCHGEVLWTIARDRARDNQQTREKKDNHPTDEDFRRMEYTINELTKELRKKDRTLKQLNALLPWKQTNGKEGGEGKDQDPYICTLSEDEFIV